MIHSNLPLDTQDPSRWSVRDQAAAIRARSLSSSELLELQLQHIDELNPQLGAVVTLETEGARAATRAADRDAVHGRWHGPLHGLSITVKDALATAGLRSTGGAKELADYVPTTDAIAVARLKRAGAIVIGKTNVPPWSADIQTFNALFGTTRNPWDATRTSGGSSGGSAVAVATGMTSFELGTDIGGSLRIPAHFCGVYSHKPSFGIVPQDGYLGHIGARTSMAGAYTVPPTDMNVVGPISRSASDLELLLDIIAGSKVAARAWRLELPPARHKTLQECRIGIWFDDAACEIDDDMRPLLEGAAEALRNSGARVTTNPPPVDLADAMSVFRGLVDGALSRNDGRKPASPGLSHADWLKLDERRARHRSAWAKWFMSQDVLLCPVLPTVAFPHDHRGSLRDRTIEVNGRPMPHTECSAWVGLASAAYLPTTVVPVGFTSAGMPVGIQIVGPFLEDRTTLFVAREIARLITG